MPQCLSKAKDPQLSMATLENYRIDDYPCSYSTSATIEACTYQGPWLLLEAELSQLASLALSGIHQNDKTLAKETTERSQF